MLTVILRIATAALFVLGATYDPATGNPLSMVGDAGHFAATNTSCGALSWRPAAAQTTPTAASVAVGQNYDATNRLIDQTVTDTGWRYVPSSASSIAYAVNDLNQYTAVGSVSPTYDGNGNLTFDGAITYGYDAESRLVSASGTGLTASYAYDARGWRKSKTVNGATTIYVADPAHREILDYDGGSGAIQHWNAFGPGANEVLNAMNVAAATRTTFIPDIQGSLIATLDSGSGAVSKAGFLAFGESAAATGSFRYTGQRIDPETNGLYYYRARMYSPALGRFLQADPIGTAGGANFYAYAANDPLNLVDPYGLTPDGPPGNSDLRANILSNIAESQAARASSNFGIYAAREARILAQSAAEEAGAVASNAANALRLSKSLASEAQMGEAGTVMAGQGGRVAFRDAARIAKEYGGNAADWVKKTSSSFTAKDGTQFETHWVENLQTGQRVEFKTKFPGGGE